MSYVLLQILSTCCVTSSGENTPTVFLWRYNKTQGCTSQVNVITLNSKEAIKLVVEKQSQGLKIFWKKCDSDCFCVVILNQLPCFVHYRYPL